MPYRGPSTPRIALFVRTACQLRLPEACGTTAKRATSTDVTRFRLRRLRRDRFSGRRGCGKPKTVAHNVRSHKMLCAARPMRRPSGSAPRPPLFTFRLLDLPFDHNLVDIQALDLRMPFGGPDYFEADAFVECEASDIIGADKCKEFFVAFVLGI
jgi:hypothetical protein